MQTSPSSLGRAGDILAEAHETVSGASEALGMLYERLQGGDGPECARIASIAFLVKRSLEMVREARGDADELISDAGRETE